MGNPSNKDKDELFLPHPVANFIEKERGDVYLPQGVAMGLLIRLWRGLVVLEPLLIFIFLIPYDLGIIFYLGNLQSGNFLLVFYIKQKGLGKYQNLGFFLSKIRRQGISELISNKLEAPRILYIYCSRQYCTQNEN